jgi:hypothetical protein
LVNQFSFYLRKLFPDFMIFSLDMLCKGSTEIKVLGFFDNELTISNEELVQ